MTPMQSGWASRNHAISSCRLRLFCLAPSGKSLLLGTIVRTRFQLVVFAGVAVEVNDLFRGIACFRHSVSPSETNQVALAIRLAVTPAPVRTTGRTGAANSEHEHEAACPRRSVTVARNQRDPLHTVASGLGMIPRPDYPIVACAAPMLMRSDFRPPWVASEPLARPGTGWIIFDLWNAPLPDSHLSTREQSFSIVLIC